MKSLSRLSLIATLLVALGLPAAAGEKLPGVTKSSWKIVLSGKIAGVDLGKVTVSPAPVALAVENNKGLDARVLHVRATRFIADAQQRGPKASGLLRPGHVTLITRDRSVRLTRPVTLGRNGQMVVTLPPYVKDTTGKTVPRDALTAEKGVTLVIHEPDGGCLPDCGP